DPIAPPMKLNSKEARTTETERMEPLITTMASLSPVCLTASVTRSGYLRLSLNLSGSMGRVCCPISTRPSASSNAPMRSRAPIRMCCLHLGQTFSVAFRSSFYSPDPHHGHSTHTAPETRRAPSFLRLILGGRIFSNQLMFDFQ